MTLLADLLSTVFDRRFTWRSGRVANDGVPLIDLAHRLVGTSGDTSGMALAEEILCRFDLLDDDKKRNFLKAIASEMNIDPENVRTTLEEYEKSPSKKSYRAFVDAAEPLRHEFIRRLNRLPGATEALVKMRAELLRLGGDDADLNALDLDFRNLLASWFNQGFLVLKPISWESPANVLEKIIAYEAVHAIESWDDLRRRLEPEDRRCFAFFHPAMPDEPLIFVEVALGKGVGNSIQTLLSEDRQPIAAEKADTAVFYSISNCQAGLAKISFGNSLIKQVAADLSAELPNLKTFVTLSPIPGLTRWLSSTGLDPESYSPEQMKSLAAHYLLNAKSGRGQPYDPVARFHLGNGAFVHAVHANADLSEKGIAQSGGAMVNYMYNLSKVAENHEAFVTTGKVVSSGDVKSEAVNAVSLLELKRAS